MWRPYSLTLLSSNVKWYECLKRMRKFDIASPARSVSVLAHSHKMSIQVGQPVKGDRMLF